MLFPGSTSGRPGALLIHTIPNILIISRRCVKNFLYSDVIFILKVKGVLYKKMTIIVYFIVILFKFFYNKSVFCQNIRDFVIRHYCSLSKGGAEYEKNNI